MVQPTPRSQASIFRRAYYGAVSFTDRNVGAMLDELSALQLAERTLVALVGDHGWQLGEMDLWRKMSNFELAVRVPLLMRVPWRPASLGRRQP